MFSQLLKNGNLIQQNNICKVNSKINLSEQSLKAPSINLNSHSNTRTSTLKYILSITRIMQIYWWKKE